MPQTRAVLSLDPKVLIAKFLTAGGAWSMDSSPTAFTGAPACEAMMAAADLGDAERDQRGYYTEDHAERGRAPGTGTASPGPPPWLIRRGGHTDYSYQRP